MTRHLLSITVLCAIQSVCLAQTSVDFSAAAATHSGIDACGSGNKVISLDPWGKVVSEVELPSPATLNDIAFCEGVTLAVGDNGALVYIKDGKPECITLTDQDLLCVGSFNGEFLIGLDNYLVRVSSELDYLGEHQISVQGRITSLSCSGTKIIGATDRNEIFSSTDGRRWTVVDFNREYDSFYTRLSITSVAAGESSMAVVGVDENSKPAMYFSADGTVWSERELSYLDHGTPVFVQSLPSGLSYDRDNDRMLLLCKNGDVLIVPGCAHCNSLVKTGIEGLKDAAVIMGGFIAVGKGSSTYSSLNQ